MKRSDITEQEIIDACDRFHSGDAETPEQVLPYPPKVILAKMERMVDKGILEYGVSLRTAWVVGHENLQKPISLDFLDVLGLQTMPRFRRSDAT